MGIESQSLEWLEKWLKVPFYDDDGGKCRLHEKQYKTVYCGACMEEPVCETCWLQHNFKQRHADHLHQVLQVRRSSRRTAVRVVDIEKFMDVSEIQVFRINGGSVVYLNPNAEGAARKPYCQTCRRQLRADYYKFCSIACKIENKGAGEMKIEKKCDEAAPAPEKSGRPTIKLKIKRATNMMINTAADDDQCFEKIKRANMMINTTADADDQFCKKIKEANMMINTAAAVDDQCFKKIKRANMMISTTADADDQCCKKIKEANMMINTAAAVDDQCFKKIKRANMMISTTADAYDQCCKKIKEANMMINTAAADDDQCCLPPVSLRKRSRKGIPHRAPLK